jgi:pyruvate formate lyase activating enzyme
MDRREFLRRLFRTGLQAASLPLALEALGLLEGEALAALGDPQEVDFYERLNGGDVRCLVCPLECILSRGEISECRTKRNRGGRLMTYAFNNPCILRVDAIEKLPLHHYMPGTDFLSVAVGGCNMRCLYCQNWQQSQSRPERLKTFYFPNRKALKVLRNRQKKDGPAIRGLGFTYTEPVVFAEYLKALSAHIRPRGYKTAVATSLFIKKKPLQDLLKHVDAMAIGLKGFREKYYSEVVGRSLAPVLDSIEVVAASGIWFEITTLIVPTYNDSREEIKDLCRWVRKTLGTRVPLHFSRFVPMYKLQNLPRTPVGKLEEARKIALDEGIQFVYCSNVAPHEANLTYCPRCKKPIIDRLGFKLLSNKVVRGRCGYCRAKIPGVWHSET